MPLGRTPVLNDDLPRGTGNFIDMSETIGIPNTHGFVDPRTGENSEDSNQRAGAISKAIPPPRTFNFPPPNNPNAQKVSSSGNSPGAYASLIRGLIADSNSEYRDELEKKLDCRIQASLQEGFSKIIQEMKKINMSDKGSEVIDSLGSGEREKGSDDLPKASERESINAKSITQRRLDFQWPAMNLDNSEHTSPRSMPITEGPEQGYNRNRIPAKTALNIDKWDISFDGNVDKMDIEEFVFRIEYMQKYHNCSWNDLRGEFHKLLKGDAKDWYWLLVQHKNINTWGELKKELRVQYGSGRSEYEFMRDFEERRQRPGETIDEYFQAMRKLRCRLRNPLPEYEVVRIIKRNLRQNISQIVYPIQVFSVEHLRNECKEVERNYFRKEHNNTTHSQPRYHNVRRQIDELAEEPPIETKVTHSVEEVRYDSEKNNAEIQIRNNLVCWNCKSVGHIFIDCPCVQRNLFCYKCGLTGVVTPTCPRCAENRSRSVRKMAESHSTKKTADPLLD